jgi:ATP-dependent helicase/nuclease subunit B
VVSCHDRTAESNLAAAEILRFVRTQADGTVAAVLVRSLDGYHEVLRRVFRRRGIPMFLDRRESVAHHPLAELTRNALRTVAFGWQREDWFSALKTGLVCPTSGLLDRLENEARARGWAGEQWRQAIVLPDNQP